MQAAPDAPGRFGDAFNRSSLKRLDFCPRRIHQELHLLLDGACFEAFESYFFTPSIHFMTRTDMLASIPRIEFSPYRRTHALPVV